MATKKFDYIAARAELDELIAWFESADISVDEAIEKYKQAEKIIGELEAYLADTQAQIEIFAKQAGVSE